MNRNPLVSVVVPTRDRPTRLRWLLNSLAEQTVGLDAFEVVIANGSRQAETSAVIASHQLANAGVLKELDTGVAGLPVQRDLGWRAGAAPLIAFTDDDCRPPADWLERIIEAAARHPGAIVQGTTRPDPDEVEVLAHAPYARTQNIVPPTRWAQTCNIVYPKALLEAIGGFDLEMPGNFAGDDTDVALRALASGADFQAAPEVLTYHAVLGGSLITRLRSEWRWSDLPYLVKRHPELRQNLPLWIFWKRTHALLPLAVTGFVLSRRSRFAILLAVPWAAHAAPDHTTSPRGRMRSVVELPGRAMLDLVGLTALARGSVRHRSILL